jgi:hypothetical protein
MMTAIRWFPHSLLSFPCTEILETWKGWGENNELRKGTDENERHNEAKIR